MNANGSEGIPRAQQGELRCACGSPEFEQTPCARLLFDRLNPKGVALEQTVRFRCADCGERLHVGAALAAHRGPRAT